MSKDIRVIKVDSFETPKCNLTEEELKDYFKAKHHLETAFIEVCEGMDALRNFQEENHIRWEESKEMIAMAFALTLQMTNNAGKSIYSIYVIALTRRSIS